MAVRCGGTSTVREVDSVVRGICEEIRKELEEKAGTQFPEFEPLQYCSQVVNGINYFVKIRIDGSQDRHLHVRVHKGHQGKTTLHSFQDNKAANDEIAHFG